MGVYTPFVSAELGRPIDVKIRRAGSLLVVYSLVAVSPDMTVGRLHVLRTKAIKTISKLHPFIVHVDIKFVPRRVPPFNSGRAGRAPEPAERAAPRAGAPAG